MIGGATDASQRPWEVPYGSFSVALDPLSAWFVVPILGLSGLAAIYGAGYLDAYRGKKSLGAPWFFFNVLVASMVMVVVARNGVLFLVAWEVMSLASYFLVTFDDEDEKVREAGRTYLVATHLGTAFLLAFFVVAGGTGGRRLTSRPSPRPAARRRPWAARCSCSPWSASAPRRGSCRCMSGFRRPILRRRAMFRP